MKLTDIIELELMLSLLELEATLEQPDEWQEFDNQEKKF